VIKSMLSALSPAGAGARLTTLIYHRVLPAEDALFPEEIHAQRFDETCGWLAAWFNVLPLDEAIVRLREERLPPRPLVITFDDGYADNHDVAMPILKRHGLCATFFIATGFLDGGRMWNDSVIESIRSAPGPDLDLRDIPDIQLDVLKVGSAQERRAAIEAVIAKVKYLPIAPRLEAVAALAQRCGGKLPDDLMMSSQQVRSMHRNGMQIGAHTENHPILASLSEPDMRGEILRSKERLQQIVDAPVTLFAYPNGKPNQDYGPAARRAVGELGFVGAVSTAPGVAMRGTDPYQIPRFTPWDRTRLRFGGRLAWGLRATNPQRVSA
jgi:peptidoglycan/xylan/chitin deacetylase (PgdA/CDA1 family)